MTPTVPPPRHARMDAAGIARAVMWLCQMGADKRQRANILGETARNLFALG